MASFITLALGATLLPFATLASDLYVDASGTNCPIATGSPSSPFCRIGDAIGVAVSGDTIHIAPGTYVESVDIATNLTLLGTAGAAQTVVDGQNTMRAVIVRAGATVTIEGLTLRNGRAGRGAGLRNLGNLTLRNSTISNCRATGWPGGGGIESLGPLTLDGCEITGNRATYAYGAAGAGVRVSGNHPVLISDTTISSNEIPAYGGYGAGLDASDNATVVLSNSTVRDNVNGNATAFYGYGGGIHASGAGSLELRNCTISGNEAGPGSGFGAGGGVRINSTPTTIVGTTISGNESGGYGGGIHIYESTVTIVNSTISNNIGCGIESYFYTQGNTLLVDHVTVTGNTPGFFGAGGFSHYSYSGVRPMVSNTIIAGNGGVDVYTYATYSTFDSRGFNLIGEADPGLGFANGLMGDIVGAPGAPIDPQLDPLGAWGGPTETHPLRPNSPAVDAANPLSTQTVDQRGFTRPTGAADIGAFERGIGVPVATCISVPNSTGTVGELAGAGAPVVTTNNMSLSASRLPLNSFGYFLTARSTGLIVGPGGSSGNLCLSGSIGRFVGPGQIQNSGATGIIAIPVNLLAHPTPVGPVAVQPGETWYYQAWHRDSGSAGPTSNFTSAMGVTFQ